MKRSGGGTVVLLVLVSGACRPSPAQETFTLQMPIRLSDFGTHFGLNPFGAHIGNHALDGHPGWDVEYRIGASALAAADGIVQSVIADEMGAKTVQIQHRHNSRTYRTVYNGLGEVDAAVVPGAPISVGQSIGVPAPRTQTVGTTSQTWASIHFQVDDFTVNRGLTNPSAVSPEAHLNAAGRAVFDALWNQAAYGQEICEPFPSNSRNAAFPLTRTWTRQSGTHAPRIDFTCLRVQADALRYALLDAAGQITESGNVQPQTFGADLSAVVLEPDNGGVRHAVLKIVSDTMLIDLGARGAPRPQGLGNASAYRTVAYPLSLSSAASYGAATLAPETIATAFGSGLAAETVAASSVPLPTTLASTRVIVKDSAGVARDAALFSVAVGQVNFVMPAGTADGPASVMVTSGDGPVFSGTVAVTRIAPGLFAANGAGSGVAAALLQRVRADGSQAVEPVARLDQGQGRFVPVPIDLGPEGEQVFLALYGTGIRLRASLAGVRARVGGIDATVAYAGTQGGAAGLDQINLLLPRALIGSGDVEVVVTIEGIAANTVTVSIR